MMKPTILHITPHFGGGVGAVLRPLIEGLQKQQQWHQRIVTLDCIDASSQSWAAAQGLTVYSEVSPSSEELHNMACAADIAHIHFWNHPLVYQFLWAFSGNTARIVVWAHCNGHHAPNMFPDAVLDFPEMFVTTSYYSLLSPTVKRRAEDWQNNHIRNITSCCDISEFTKVVAEKHCGITVGYIGTVDYCKMHRDSIEMLTAVSNPEVHFEFYGGDSHEILEAEARAKGLASRFNFFGKVQNIPEVLSKVDIFAYPLHAEHYGTGEQVLVEAMAAGIPQVVLNNGPESNIVDDGVTGIVASDSESFSRAIDLLAGNPALRRQMGEESRKRAERLHSVDRMINAWTEVYSELATRSKKRCIFNYSPLQEARQDDIPTQLFLCSRGQDSLKKIFSALLECYPSHIPMSLCREVALLPPIHFSESKGSIHQFSHFLKDKKLDYISKSMREIFTIKT